MEFNCRKVNGGWILESHGHNGIVETVTFDDVKLLSSISSFIDSENETIRMRNYLENPCVAMPDIHDGAELINATISDLVAAVAAERDKVNV